MGIKEYKANSWIKNNVREFYPDGNNHWQHTITFSGATLPDAYQEVEYISTNTTVGQYIDTGFIPDYRKGFRITMKFMPVSTSSIYALLANYNSGDKQLSLELKADNKARLWLNSGALDQASSNTFQAGKASTVIFTYENGSWSIALNGTITTGSYSVTGASTTSMYMFLDRALRTGTFTKQLRIYYCKIESEDKLIKYFVPCYRKSDSVIGMFEQVSETFYTNSGTGTFVKGNNIVTTAGNWANRTKAIDHSAILTRSGNTVTAKDATTNAVFWTNAYTPGSANGYTYTTEFSSIESPVTGDQKIIATQTRVGNAAIIAYYLDGGTHLTPYVTEYATLVESQTVAIGSATKAGYTLKSGYPTTTKGTINGTNLTIPANTYEQITITWNWLKNVTITATNQTKQYDGNTLWADNTISASGLLDGHTAIATCSGETSGINASSTGTKTVDTVVIKDANNNDVTSMYNITKVDGTLTINKRNITIKADNKTKTYGTANPTLSYQITSGSLISSSDLGTISCSCSATQNSNVGQYDITVTYTANSNYNVSTIPGTLVINKATITSIAAPTDRSPVYNASEQKIINDGTTTGGNYIYTNQSQTDWQSGGYTVTWSFTADSNHTIGSGVTSSGTINANISKRPITSTISANKYSFTYGTTPPTYETGIAAGTDYSGLINGHLATISVSGAPTSSSNVGSYTVTATITDVKNSLNNSVKNNYSFTNGTCSVSVTKATPTYTAPTLVSGTLTYNETPQTIINAGSTSHGTIYYKVDNGSYGLTAQYRQATNAGTHSATWKLIGDSNHTDIEPTSLGSKTINKRTVTLTSPIMSGGWEWDNQSRDTSADGSVSAGGTMYYYQSTSSTTPTFSTSTWTTTRPQASAIRTYYLWVYAYVSDTDNNSGGNTVTYVGSTTISKHTISLTWDTTTWTYDGTEKTVSAPTVGSTVSGYGCTVSVSNNKRTNAGSQTVTASISTGGDYYKLPSNYQATLTINKASQIAVISATPDLVYGAGGRMVTVTTSPAENATIYYAVNIALDQSNYNTQGSTSRPLAAMRDAGYYDVYYYILTTTNYLAEGGFVRVHIDRATPTFTRTNGTTVYPTTATGTVSSNVNGSFYWGLQQNAVNNGPITLLAGEPTNAVQQTTVGETTVYVYFVPDDTTNYTNVGSSTAGLAVSAIMAKADQTWTLDIGTTALTSGDSTTYSISGTTYGTKSASLSSTTYATLNNYAITASGSPGGATTTLTVTYPGNGNYNSRTQTKTITLYTKCVAPSQSGSLTYTGTEQTATFGTPTYCSLTSGNTGTLAKSYYATFTTTNSAKYRFPNAATTNNVSWSIGKKALTAKADNKTITYGDSAPSYTVTYTGFVNNETSSVLTTAATASCSGYDTGTVAKRGAGTYTIYCSGATAVNYNITHSNGTLTVNKATLTCTGSSHTVTYGAAEPTLSISYSGWKYSEGAAILTTVPIVATTYTSSTNVSSSPVAVTVSGGVSGNYSFSYVNGAITINKANQTWTISVGTTTLTSGDSTSYSISGTTYGTVTASVNPNAYASVSGTTITASGSPGGSTTSLTVSAPGDGNHNSRSQSKTITLYTKCIAPSQSGTLTYNGSSQSPTWTTPTYCSVTSGNTKTNAGTYYATFTTTNSSKYRFANASTTGTAQWSIGRATPTFEAQNSIVMYPDEANGKVLASVAGTVYWGTSASSMTQTVSINANTATSMVSQSSVGERAVYTYFVPSDTTNYVSRVPASGHVLVTAKVNPMQGTISFHPVSQTCTYSTNSQTVTCTAATNNSGTLSYSLQSVKDSSNNTVTGWTIGAANRIITIPASQTADAYTVTVKATSAANGNYAEATSTKSFTITINKASGTITYNPTAKTCTYSSSSQTVTCTAASGATGTISYTLNSVKQGSTSISGFSLSGTTLTVPAGRAVGSYTVQITATSAATTNYTQATSQKSFTLTIETATYAVSWTAPDQCQMWSSTSGTATSSGNASGTKYSPGTTVYVYCKVIYTGGSTISHIPKTTDASSNLGTVTWEVASGFSITGQNCVYRTSFTMPSSTVTLSSFSRSSNPTLTAPSKTSSDYYSLTIKNNCSRTATTLYYKTSSGGWSSKSVSVTSGSTYNLTGLDDGTTYTFYFQFVYNGWNWASATGTGTTTTVPSGPTETS